VRQGGQLWLSYEEFAAEHHTRIEEKEPDLWGVGVEPSFAIGQRALLVRTPEGNLLWDCVPLLDEAGAARLDALGGVRAVAISHPHYYGGYASFAERFGAEILLHEADREHAHMPDPKLRFWQGERFSPFGGITLIRAGGHFAGGTVAHWPAGADGRGVLLTGDILQVIPDRRFVGFMYSYPNLIPLPPAEVERVAASVAPFAFDRMVGAWWGRVIPEGGREVVARSAKRYAAAVARRLDGVMLPPADDSAAHAGAPAAARASTRATDSATSPANHAATDPATTPHASENRRHWNEHASDWVEAGERHWAEAEPTWGIWGVPESELGMFPDDMRGMDAVELGCGTGYVSSWMARRGARVTGIDVSEEQLATARRLAREHGVDLTLVHGDAERTPFEDESFDFAISEYGAAIWCDPHVWIAEAKRILRPGGRLVFLANHPLALVCAPDDGGPATERMARPYFGMHRLDWTQVEIDPGGIEFNLAISEWFALFRRLGLEVEGFLEPRPKQGGSEARFFASADWARNWPSEQVWKVRKPA
jgi:SAM-dependent methyltransferase